MLGVWNEPNRSKISIRLNTFAHDDLPAIFLTAQKLSYVDVLFKQNAECKKNSVNLIISGLFSSDSCAESSFLNSVRSEDNNQRHQKQKYRMHFLMKKTFRAVSGSQPSSVMD